MPLALTSPEDISNAALGRIGYKLRVGSLYSGSDAAAAILDIYAQTRDEELRAYDYGFAGRTAPLALLKTAPPGGYSPVTPWTPANPILPWIYEYGWPDDCIKVRALRAATQFIPEFAPKAVNFLVANDNSLNPQQKVILADLASAILVYTARVTDPTLWDADFAEVMITSLARRFAPRLTDLNVEKAEAQDEAITTAGAEMRVG